MTGLEISRQFINDLLLPLMQAELGERCDRLAVAIIGTGSDVLGLDDPISRDHHWGPRANILYTRQDAEELAPPVGKLLRDDLPAHYDGHPLHVDIGNLTGVCHSEVEGFFERFLATTKLPQRDEDWLGLCEVDLFHVTSGEVVFDGLGEMTARREALSYYPEAIWKKRIADWCMYVSGRESPYNLHRVGKREDDLTCTIYLGQCLKRQMEFCFMLNRQYAPYTKWLNVCFRRLPQVADQLAPIIDAVMAERDWAQRVRLLIDGNYVLADAIAALGLTAPVERREFDEGLTDLTLYDSAAQIYGQLPRSLRDPSFNQIEHWEKMARDVLFDTNDYLGERVSHMMDEAIKRVSDRPAEADRLLSALEAEAYVARDTQQLQQIWPHLSEARRRRRQRAAAGRIDLHTHTTASDGEMTVEQLLCEHFVTGQILIDDHNIIDSLAAARQLVHDRDLELDVFLGIEVICTHERRSFEFHAIAPTLSPEFTELCAVHRGKWNRACERFVDELCNRDRFFEDPIWQQIEHDFSVGGPLGPVLERYEQVRARIIGDDEVRANYLRNNQTFDMGNLWHAWELAQAGDPPQLAHRFFAAMRCYALNAYRDELGDWFAYESLATQFREVGCVISHNHPNYWDEDFVGELTHQQQTEWVREFAARGVIDALEVWSPPFASQRVPHYWEKVCEELNLIPMAGTDCHSGREQEFGGEVENHPEIPARLYEQLTRPACEGARAAPGGWSRQTAWRQVLEIDYAHDEALSALASEPWD